MKANDKIPISRSMQKSLHWFIAKREKGDSYYSCDEMELRQDHLKVWTNKIPNWLDSQTVSGSSPFIDVQWKKKESLLWQHFLETLPLRISTPSWRYCSWLFIDAPALEEEIFIVWLARKKSSALSHHPAQASVRCKHVASIKPYRMEDTRLDGLIDLPFAQGKWCLLKGLY